MEAITCPICQKQLESCQYLSQDSLSEHFRQNNCDPRSFKEDTLDLYQYFLTDMLATLNILSQLSNLRYLFIRQPQASLSRSLVNYIFNSDATTIYSDQTKNFIEMKIPGNAKIEESFLQIPFDQIQQDCKFVLILQKREFLDREQRQEFGIKANFAKSGIFFTDKELSYHFGKQRVYYEETDATFTVRTTPWKIFKNLKEYKQYFHKQQDNSDNESNIAAYQIEISPSILLRIRGPDSHGSSQQLVEEYENEQLLQSQQKSFVDRTLNYLKSIISSQESQDRTAVFDSVPRLLSDAARRRLLSVCVRKIMTDLIMYLCPNIINIDGVKITEQMRKIAKKNCIDRFSFPHKQTFPTLSVQNSEQPFYFSWLKQLGVPIPPSMQKKILTGSILDFITINRGLANPSTQNFPIRAINQSIQAMDQCSFRTMKANIVRKVVNPQLFCLTNTNQLQQQCLHMTYQLSSNILFQDDHKLFQQFGKPTKLACFKHDKLLIGTELGVVYCKDPSIPLADEIEIKVIQNKQGKQLFNYPCVSSIDFSNQKYKQKVTSIAKNIYQRNTVCFGTLAGGIYTFDDSFRKILFGMDSGFNSVNALDFFDTQIVAGGQGGLLHVDIVKNMVQDIFQIQGKTIGKQTFYLAQQNTDPGYYDITQLKFIDQNLLLTGDAAGGIRLLDLRLSSSEIFKYSGFNLPIDSIDINQNNILIGQLDSRFTLFDMRSEKQQRYDFGLLKSINNHNFCQFFAGGKKVISAGQETGLISIYDIDNFKIYREIHASSYGFGSDIKYGNVQLYDIQSCDYNQFSFIQNQGNTTDVFTYDIGTNNN